MTTIEDPPHLLAEFTRRDFSVFVRRAWPLINGGAPLEWNWHLDALCYQLERVRRGMCRRLIINIPPRNGKSKIASSIWPSFLLGNLPTVHIVGVSYSNELSGKLSRDCITLMQTAFYRELFPRTVISRKRSKSDDFDTTAGGGRLATSVTGTLTGRGGDIIILDDVIKPEEANSENAREFVNNWFRSTLISREDDKRTGGIIVVMQRLHQDDLTGMLLEEGGWDVLSLPAIAPADAAIPLMWGNWYARTEGEVLHPAREPIEILERQKAAMGSIGFSAQYQQDPVPATGNMIQAEWLGQYDPALFEGTKGQVIQSWDTASKDNPHNDYSVCITVLKQGRKIYLLDVFRRRLKFPDLKAHAVKLAREHRADVLLIEDQSSGSQLIQTLRAENPKGVPSPVARRPEQDKVARVAGVSAMIEAGRLLLPYDAPWLADFRSELLGFPNARFDDQVDALSQLFTWVRDRERYDISDAIGAPITA